MGKRCDNAHESRRAIVGQLMLEFCIINGIDEACCIDRAIVGGQGLESIHGEGVLCSPLKHGLGRCLSI